MASEVAVIGAEPEVVGFGLAGARVYLATDAAQVRAAWQELPRSVAVVVLDVAAAEVLAAEICAPRSPLTVVLPA